MSFIYNRNNIVDHSKLINQINQINRNLIHVTIGVNLAKWKAFIVAGLQVQETARKMTEAADMRRMFFARITWRNRKSLEKGTRSSKTSAMAWFACIPILGEIIGDVNTRQRLRIIFVFIQFTLAPLRVPSRTDSSHDVRDNDYDTDDNSPLVRVSYWATLCNMYRR